MPVEMLIDEYEKQRKIIAEAQKKQDEIIEKIKSSNEESDWVTVKAAAKIMCISEPYVYQLIGNGKIKNIRHIGSKKLLNRKEIESINDR